MLRINLSYCFCMRKRRISKQKDITSIRVRVYRSVILPNKGFLALVFLFCLRCEEVRHSESCMTQEKLYIKHSCILNDTVKTQKPD